VTGRRLQQNPCGSLSSPCSSAGWLPVDANATQPCSNTCWVSHG